MTPEQMWRGRPDSELVAAAGRLDDYYAEGQWAVLSELARRGLRMPDGSEPVVPPMPAPEPAAPAVAQTEAAEPVDVYVPAETPVHRNPPFWPPGRAMASVWRGEFSLATTYWGFSQLGGLLLAIPQLGLRMLKYDRVADVVDGVAVAYAVVVIVGIWRAAARYPGHPFWAGLARAATLAPIVFALITLATQQK